MRSTHRRRSVDGRARSQRPAARVQATRGSTGPCPQPARPGHNLRRAGGRRSEFPCEAILWTKANVRRAFRMQATPWQSGRPRAVVAAGFRCNSWPAVGSLERGTGSVRTRLVWWSALPMLAAVPGAGAAQTVAPPTPAAATTQDAAEQIVDFSADEVIYDSNSDVVTATGEVRMNREGNYLGADQVVWNRKTGKVTAQGNVVMVTPEGDKLVGDHVVLTDPLRDGTVENLMGVLEGGARIAAQRGTRSGQTTTLENAIYSPCPVTTDAGCPKRPSWAITAARVIDDPVHKQIRFEGGRLQLFGVDLPLLPIFKIARGNEGATGWLVPDLSLSSRNGVELA